MNADPATPSSSEPALSKPGADPAAETADPLPLKRRVRKGSTEAEEGENTDQTIQLLSTLLQDLIAKKEQSGGPETPETKSTAKYHRLSKTGASSGSPAEPFPTAVASPESPAGPAARPVAASPALAPAPVVNFRPAPLYDPAEGLRRLRLWQTLFFFGIIVSAVATYYAVKRLEPAAGARSAAAPASAWNDATIQQLDQALAADQAGDLRGALRIAGALKKPDGSMPPGLSLYLASLETRLDRNFDAEADLLRLANNASPELTALANERLAFNFLRTRDFDKALEAFRVISQNDPFAPRPYYYLGEVYRHQGHFDDAMAAFRRALARVPTGQPENESLSECIALKMRLCLVESNREGEFQAELVDHLQRPAPSGYWQLTAAAVALQHKDMPAAAGALAKARDVLGPEQFDSLLNDYFFRAYADRKELADFFPSDPAARRAKVTSSMAYTVEP